MHLMLCSALECQPASGRKPRPGGSMLHMRPPSQVMQRLETTRSSVYVWKHFRTSPRNTFRVYSLLRDSYVHQQFLSSCMLPPPQKSFTCLIKSSHDLNDRVKGKDTQYYHSRITTFIKMCGKFRTTWFITQETVYSLSLFQNTPYWSRLRLKRTNKQTKKNMFNVKPFLVISDHKK